MIAPRLTFNRLENPSDPMHCAEYAVTLDSEEGASEFQIVLVLLGGDICPQIHTFSDGLEALGVVTFRGLLPALTEDVVSSREYTERLREAGLHEVA